MIAIDIHNSTFALPENWDEVIDRGKYLEVVRINYTETDITQAKIRVLSALSGLDGVALGGALGAATAEKRGEQAASLSAFFALQVVEELFPLLDFIFTPELFTRNPLAVIRHGGKKYYGHADNLTRQTGAEMEETGWAYTEWIKTNDEKYMDHLVAALYRPAGTLFDREAVTGRAAVFATLDPVVKRGVLMWYEMCEEWWRRQYEALYRSAEKEGERDSLANSRLMRTLAGEKRGTVNAVREMSRDEIFFELSELERERQQMEN